MADADLFIQNGNAGDFVTQLTNSPSSPGATPIAEITPDRGLFVRIANAVSKGSERGVPVYMRLRDSNNNLLPASTAAYFEMEIQGQEQAHKVSAKRAQISHYVANDLTTQRNTDNVDTSKFVLQRPETSPVSQPASALEVRDIDSLYFSIDSSAEIDWSNSEWYVDTEATDKGSLSRRA